MYKLDHNEERKSFWICRQSSVLLLINLCNLDVKLFCFKSIVHELYCYCISKFVNKKSWLASLEAARARGNSDRVFLFHINPFEVVMTLLKLNWLVCKCA